VSNGIVIFSVNNSWIKENGLAPEDIKLYKWQDDGWVEKTTEIADNNTNQTYYASLVGNFSSFAVSGDKKQDVVPTLSQEPEENTTQAISDSPVKSPIDFNLVLGIFPIIGIIGLAYYFRMRGRKNNK
jgi:ATP-dependent Zn protease